MGHIEPIGYITDGEDICARCAESLYPEPDSEFSRVSEKLVESGAISPQYYYDFEDRGYSVFCEACGSYIGGDDPEEEEEDDDA